MLTDTEAWWLEWSSRCTLTGRWRDLALRSLITLKALTFSRTGGIVVAAPTTALPEWIGGPRNWDYRFCWLRDATFTLYALLLAGYTEEALAWRDWAMRAIAGDPDDLQILYGLAGERRLPETELPWLPGAMKVASECASEMPLTNNFNLTSTAKSQAPFTLATAAGPAPRSNLGSS